MGGGPKALTVDTSKRLAALRGLMVENNVQAYVVPSEDQHFSEYLADCDARRAFISGFTGSAGLAVIGLKSADLFTDGRYFLQAGQQLDSNWVLQKQGVPDVPTWTDFLLKNLDAGTRIGVDPKIISAKDAKTITESLKAKGSTLVAIKENLVDTVWGSDRPPRTETQIYPLDVKYSGKSSTTKLAEIREQLAKKNVSALVVNTLDEVAWLFNLRASDIQYNPVFFAYALVTRRSATLFVNKNQLSSEAHQNLDPEVDIRPYEAIVDEISSLDLSSESANAKIWLGTQGSWALAEAIGERRLYSERSPITDAKSIKNDVEIEGFRQAHIRDGGALVQYFAWLEEELNSGKKLTEYEGATKLEEFRSKLDHFKGLSFDTISSTGPNGAIIHYSPSSTDSAIIQKDDIYLCDSGAQFIDGTTDVTRTLHFGTPKSQEIRAFTRVLQGHIAIDTAIFPAGTSGFLLDSWARRSLWKEGLDYRHGTGHGVGHFLNVHEGPQGVGTRIAYNDIALKPGMTLSNEPGYYEDGKFGIRIENVCVVTKANTPNNFGDRGYLTFENFTFCPIQTKLVDSSLLTTEEREWINAYHNRVLEKIKPGLVKSGDKRAITWLERECQPI